MNRKFYIYGAIFVVLAAAPYFLNPYWVDVLNNVGLYAILGLSLIMCVLSGAYAARKLLSVDPAQLFA